MRDQEGGENLDKTREQDLQQKTHKGTEKKGHSVDTNIKRKKQACTCTRDRVWRLEVLG